MAEHFSEMLQAFYILSFPAIFIFCVPALASLLVQKQSDIVS
jgi:hypothetical protein